MNDMDSPVILPWDQQHQASVQALITDHVQALEQVLDKFGDDELAVSTQELLALRSVLRSFTGTHDAAENVHLETAMDILESMWKDRDITPPTYR